MDQNDVAQNIFQRNLSYLVFFQVPEIKKQTCLAGESQTPQDHSVAQTPRSHK